MTITRLLSSCVFAAAVAFAQTPAPAPAATPAPAPSPWSVGGIDFSGLVDGYYSLNFNHPASKTNQLYNFDVQANQFSLNMAKLSLAHATGDKDPVGFQVDFGFGKAFDIIHAGEQAPGIFRNIEQAYISLKPPKAKGLQIDFGKFVTSAGAEVIESNANWNYSRSLLFAYAIPYYHFGVRLTQPIGSHFSGGFQVVNGWNNVEDNNTGKTLGFVGNFTGKKISWSNNYYTGPEKTNTNQGFRNLYDTTVLLTPGDKFNAYVNFDYGSDKNVGKGSNTWAGIAIAAKMQATEKSAFTPRFEYFNDMDGFSTGTTQKLKEFTLTYEYKLPEGFLARAEYRRDWSNQKFFDRGAQLGRADAQSTLTLGIVAFFGPKR